MANEITAELNDEQFKKYKVMQENGMGIGDAIDLIFSMREELELNNNQLLEERLQELNTKKESLAAEMDKVNKELGIIDKISDTSLDFDAKSEILEKEYAAIDETYEMKVQAHKRRIQWSKFISNFR